MAPPKKVQGYVKNSRSKRAKQRPRHRSAPRSARRRSTSWSSARASGPRQRPGRDRSQTWHPGLLSRAHASRLDALVDPAPPDDLRSVARTVPEAGCRARGRAGGYRPGSFGPKKATRKNPGKKNTRYIAYLLKRAQRPFPRLGELILQIGGSAHQGWRPSAVVTQPAPPKVGRHPPSESASHRSRAPLRQAQFRNFAPFLHPNARCRVPLADELFGLRSIK